MERCGGLGSSREEQRAVGKDREQWGGIGRGGEGQREVGSRRPRIGDLFFRIIHSTCYTVHHIIPLLVSTLLVMLFFHFLPRRK